MTVICIERFNNKEVKKELLPKVGESYEVSGTHKFEDGLFYKLICMPDDLYYTAKKFAKPESDLDEWIESLSDKIQQEKKLLEVI